MNRQIKLSFIDNPKIENSFILIVGLQ